MVSREQAQVIGEALVTQALRESHERKNAAVRPRSFMHRLAELNSFETWERPIVVAEASKSAMRNASVLGVWALSSAFAVGFAYFAMTEYKRIPLPLILVAACVILAPAYFYRREVIRRHIRERAKLRR